jgi:hypothetical protein
VPAHRVEELLEVEADAAVLIEQALAQPLLRDIDGDAAAFSAWPAVQGRG